MKGYRTLRVVLGVSRASGSPEIEKKEHKHGNAPESFYVVKSALHVIKLDFSLPICCFPPFVTSASHIFMIQPPDTVGAEERRGYCAWR